MTHFDYIDDNSLIYSVV